MSKLNLSDLIWGSWIAQFLILEIVFALILGKIYTLSNTSWIDEDKYKWLGTILLGFLMGLAIHIRWKTGLWKTEAVTVPLALITDLIF